LGKERDDEQVVIDRFARLVERHTGRRPEPPPNQVRFPRYTNYSSLAQAAHWLDSVW
jgi:hypothetical protein